MPYECEYSTTDIERGNTDGAFNIRICNRRYEEDRCKALECVKDEYYEEVRGSQHPRHIRSADIVATVLTYVYALNYSGNYVAEWDSTYKVGKHYRDENYDRVFY